MKDTGNRAGPQAAPYIPYGTLWNAGSAMIPFLIMRSWELEAGKDLYIRFIPPGSFISDPIIICTEEIG
ncbi:MAG: hypothetical protein ACLUIQ_09205 [Dialister invisus]